MDQGPLVTEQIEAGAKLVRDFSAQYKPLQAAFWLKEDEEKPWYLYLASDQIDDSNFDLAYGEVIRLMGHGPHLWLGPFQVKVIPADRPLAKAVIDIQRKYGKFATRINGSMLGGRYVDGAFLYTLPIEDPATVLSAG